jgi:hypothetical protein
VLEHRLLVLRVVVLGVLGDVAELAGDADALGDVATTLAAEGVELGLERFVALGGENDVSQGEPPDRASATDARDTAASRGRAS